MDIIIEELGELLIEGIFEIIKNKKISKWIRYPLAIIFILFYIVIISLMVYVGIISFEENKLISIFFFLIAVFLLIAIIHILKKQA